MVATTLALRYHEGSGSAEPVAVYERSIRVAGEVFLNKDRGLLKKVDAAILQHECEALSDIFERRAFHLYLACDEDEMLRRVYARNRLSERFLRSKRLVELKTDMDAWALAQGYEVMDTTDLSPDEVAAALVDWEARGCPAPEPLLSTAEEAAGSSRTSP